MITTRTALAPGALTDVAGLLVGHAAVDGQPSGCTVLLCPQGVTAGVDLRGGAPGTRETDPLRPGNQVQQVDALLLTGGSAFGLDATAGVMRWLEVRGHGFAVGAARVPIVPAAVIFDLWLGDTRLRPDAATGHAACAAASAQPPAQGNAGAGLGATVGKLWGLDHAMKGGLGAASLRVGGLTVAALVVVNAAGDVLDAHGRVLAGARSDDGRTLRGSPAALALSRDNRLSAAQLARLLQQQFDGPTMPELMASLPVTGLDGTLRRSRAGTGRAHLKTGSLRDVAALAGCVLADSGQRYVFVALIQHPNAGFGAARPALDALVQWTARDLTAR